MITRSYRCGNCGELGIDIDNKWCKSCLMNILKPNFTNWTSGSERIDEFIQEMQLKINDYDKIIVEWIPYNQFNDIKELIKVDSVTIYSATWLNGPLEYDYSKKEYERIPNKKVTLKCLDNSQNTINEFLNEVRKF
jgi:hypothetical protein